MCGIVLYKTLCCLLCDHFFFVFYKSFPRRSLSSPVQSVISNNATIQPPVSMESRVPTVGGTTAPAPPNMAGGQAGVVGNIDREQIYTWIQELTHPETREQALLELRCVQLVCSGCVVICALYAPYLNVLTKFYCP